MSDIAAHRTSGRFAPRREFPRAGVAVLWMTTAALLIAPASQTACLADWLDTFEGNGGGAFAPQDHDWSLAALGTASKRNGNTDDETNDPEGNDWLEIKDGIIFPASSVLAHVTDTFDGSDTVFQDVRVTGWVNYQEPIPSEPASDSGQGVAARFDGFGSVYTLVLDFTTGDLNLAKAEATQPAIVETVTSAISDLDSRYFVELTAWNSPDDTRAMVTGRVFDGPQGNLIANTSFMDPNPLNPGTSGVVVNDPFDLSGSFDDVASSFFDAFPTGDMDFDRDIDFDDIDDFVLGLNDPSTYTSTFFAPPEENGDTDNDMDLDFDDIPGFVELLSPGSTHGVPEPTTSGLMATAAGLMSLLEAARLLRTSNKTARSSAHSRCGECNT